MPRESIKPHRVTRPLQLLAAWLVALILLNGSFLVGAQTIRSPGWIAPLLVIAAVVNVPMFIMSAFLLLTRFRAELQEDQFYARHLEHSARARGLAKQIDLLLKHAGIDLSAPTLPSPGRAEQFEIDGRLTKLRGELEDELASLEKERSSRAKPAAPEARLELGKLSLAERDWRRAATYLAEYSESNPTDWESHLLAGVAYANMREGRETDLAALRAYSEALALAPEELDDNRRARLLAYRGAMLKRLGRFQEAESDLLLARELAEATSIVHDAIYNLAGVYAQRGDRLQLMCAVKELRDAPAYLRAIEAHLADYFVSFAGDEEFREAIGRHVG